MCERGRPSFIPSVHVTTKDATSVATNCFVVNRSLKCSIINSILYFPYYCYNIVIIASLQLLLVFSVWK